MDYTSLTDDELAAIFHAATEEHSRRAVLQAAQTRNPGLGGAYLAQQGRGDGTPWVQPLGAHDAYPLGHITTHDGKTWVSLIDGNVWEPGVSGWREEVEDGGAPAWVQPTGGHDTYPLGAVVTHAGRRWESTAASNAWEPGTYGWTDLGPA